MLYEHSYVNNIIILKEIKKIKKDVRSNDGLLFNRLLL